MRVVRLPLLVVCLCFTSSRGVSRSPAMGAWADAIAGADRVAVAWTEFPLDTPGARTVHVTTLDEHDRVELRLAVPSTGGWPRLEAAGTDRFVLGINRRGETPPRFEVYFIEPDGVRPPLL